MRAGLWVALVTVCAASGAGCLGRRVLDAFCDEGSCAFSRDEWTRLQGLTNLGPPPRDDSNLVDGNPAAIELGRARWSRTTIGVAIPARRARAPCRSGRSA
jgi:hypothetical protein